MRKIIHIDMDAFYASVEQRDNPDLIGKPVAVGGSPSGRGVVAAASYEARKYGVRSALSSAVAARLCPSLIFVKPRMSVYRRVSRVIMAILREYSEKVEPLSFDEAYVDVTDSRSRKYASQIARAMKDQIFQITGLTASAGVAPNKFLAKIASDLNKPNGLAVIQPHEVESFLETLPIRKIPGVGKVTEEKFARRGVLTVGHLRRWTQPELESVFGKHGSWFYNLARGIDERDVGARGRRKSMSSETTFSKDSRDQLYLQEVLGTLSCRVAEGLKKNDLVARTVNLKVKYADFSHVTRNRTLDYCFQNSDEICSVAVELLGLTDAGIKPVRLLGVGVSNLMGEERRVDTDYQLALQF